MITLFLIYFFLSFAIIYLSSFLSYRFKLLDIPNDRKKHSKPVAYTGGLAISICYLVSLILFNITSHQLSIIISISFLITAIGFIDDKYNLNIGGKLSLQIIPIFYLVVFEGIKLYSLGEYNFFELKLNNFSIPFTIFCVLLLINAFNYFDGLDGTLSFSFISVIAILLYLINDPIKQTFLITLILPIIIFIFFNFSFFKLPKLFLGDSGSLLLGFITSFILIYLSYFEKIHPILLAWSIVLFVYEFIFINIQRIRKNKNIFKPGFDHLHHILYRRTNSIFWTNFIMFSSNILFFFAGNLSFQMINSSASFILFVMSFFVYFIFRNLVEKNN